MNESKIVIEYVCKCDNRTPVTGDISDSNKGVAYGFGYGVVVPVLRGRLICLNCGKDMKLRVSKEELKTEITIISET